MEYLRRSVAAWCALVILLGSPVGVASGEAPDAARRQEIETIIRDYLRTHPEVVMEALQEMQRREGEARRRQAAEAVRANLAELTQDPASPVGGNPQGTVTVVEFFDYQCGYCKRQHAAMKQLLQADPDVRLVYKELPILGATSLFAARAALAAQKQGKYEALHSALMATDERLSEPGVLQLAAQIGLDVARLEKDMADPSVAAALERNAQLQRALNIRGTPALVIGTEFIAGTADLETLKALVARARAK